MHAPVENIAVEEVTGKDKVIVFPSGAALMGDPCYFDRLRRNAGPDFLQAFLDSDAHTKEFEDCLIIRVAGDMPVMLSHLDQRVSEWELGSWDTPYHERGPYTKAYLGVDSGQMSIVDLGTFLTAWSERDYEDVRIYEHIASGKRLQYKVDFPHYETPIASEGGKTMNELNATGEWRDLDYQGDIDWSYNGLSHSHDNEADATVLGGRGLVTGTGYGDGQYETVVWTGDKGAEHLLIVFLEEDEQEDGYDEYEEDEEE